MKALIAILLSGFIGFNSGLSYANTDMAEPISIIEHWISLTTSYDIKTKTKKIGTLYRKPLSFLLTYEFYDPFDKKLAIARSKFFSITAHFDIYDTNQQVIGAANEQIFTFFPTFDIFGKDGITKLATANMNFWGTTFTLYDPITNQEMAELTRSFIRIKNNWTFTITNPELFSQKDIDSRVLMTVIAFQGDREYWESQNNHKKRQVISRSSAHDKVTAEHISEQIERINKIASLKALALVEKPDAKTLANIIKELDDGFQNQGGRDGAESNREKFDAFVDYCLTIVQAHTISDAKKKAILYLLKMRLASGAY